MKQVAIASFLSFCLTIATPSWATDPSPCDLRQTGSANLYHMEMSDLLKIGEFQKLEASMEKHFEALLKEGNGDHLFNLTPFLNMTSKPGSQLMSQWKKEMPDAFFQNYTTGMNLIREVDHVRYGRAANAIDAKDREKISVLQKNAREALALAKTANPQRAIVDAALLEIDATNQGPEAIKAQLKQANLAAPKNISARLSAINYLSPRWGGSFEAMDEIIDQAKSEKLPASHIAYLTMAVENAKGSHFEVIERDKAKAREHYKKAYAICDKSDFAKNGLARTTGD